MGGWDYQPHRDLQSLTKHCPISALAIAKKHERERKKEMGKVPSLPSGLVMDSWRSGQDLLPPPPASATSGPSVLHFFTPPWQAAGPVTAMLGDSLLYWNPASRNLPPSPAKPKEHELFETFPCALVLICFWFFLFYSQLC